MGFGMFIFRTLVTGFVVGSTYTGLTDGWSTTSAYITAICAIGATIGWTYYFLTRRQKKQLLAMLEERRK